MVFRLADSEYSNRHLFEASVQRRTVFRKVIVSITLFALAFSSSWVVMLAINGAVPTWLGCMSCIGSVLAMFRALQVSKNLPAKPLPRHRLHPASRCSSGSSSGAWIGRNILPVALILKK